MELLEIEQTLAIAVIILQEEILVVAFQESIRQLDYCIVIEKFALTFGQNHTAPKALIG